MRVIARIDIKNEHVIKGVHLEGLRKVGAPKETARAYYAEGIDEIVFMDAVASLYDRNNLFHIVEAACDEVFVPIVVGGGIRTLDDVSAALEAGADKVAINTGAVRNPGLVEAAAKRYGSQCVVGSIEAVRSGESWEACIDNGRDRTGKDAVEWARELESLGAGELLVTSVDREGTQRGFDVALIRAVQDAVTGPVVACGGYGKAHHFAELVRAVTPSGVALASALHYRKESIESVKGHLLDLGVAVRK